MPFVASIDLGVVGDDITSVKLFACVDSECSSCTELIGYEEVLVSDFPMEVGDIPNGTINIRVESIGRCEVFQCIPIVGITTITPTATPTPTSTNTPTPTPTGTTEPPTETPTPTPTNTPTPTPTNTPTATPTPTNTPTPTEEPSQSYVLVGPYSSASEACVAGNTTGGVLGFFTVTDDNIVIGSIVYNNPLFGTPSPVSGAPGWYAIGASFIGIYSAIRLDNTGTIVELGGFCFF